MDANTDPLAGLHDLARPTPPDWLPPQGPGWWLLGLLLLAALAWGSWRLWQWRRRSRYRREALAQLEHLAPGLGAPESLAELSALLKRTALVAYPREVVAALTGNPWRDFLCTNGAPAFAAAACDPLFESTYRADCGTTPQQRAALIAAARQWIVAHRASRQAGAEQNQPASPLPGPLPQGERENSYQGGSYRGFCDDSLKEPRSFCSGKTLQKVPSPPAGEGQGEGGKA